ncbi:MAG TPA: ribosome maturation factor RimM [Actinomycetes bacterium]|nr:ribosome maturation factor RimM [Actinomycetes bacterium]
MAAPARLVVGRVIRPHGVRGEVMVEILSDAPERFSPGARLAAGDPDRPESLRDLEVEAARPHQGRMLLRLAGLQDRDAVETLRGLLLSIPFGHARGLAAGEYWPHQLVGLEVVDHEGRERGVVADVQPGAAHDLLAVRRPDGHVVLVPAVAALVTVELDAGRLVVHALPGLLED